MSAQSYAVIEKGVVTNLVLWDPEAGSRWTPPAGAIVTAAPEGVGVGDNYDSKLKQFTPRVLTAEELSQAKDMAIATIDSNFMRAQMSMLVGADAREKMRSVAVAAALAVRSATSADEVDKAMSDGVVAIKTLKGSL
jgi:hypothetical protein